MSQTFISKRIGKLWGEIGWFSGNAPCLFHLEIGWALEDYLPPQIRAIVLFSLQIVKFVFAVGVDV